MKRQCDAQEYRTHLSNMENSGYRLFDRSPNTREDRDQYIAIKENGVFHLVACAIDSGSAIQPMELTIYNMGECIPPFLNPTMR